MSTAARPGSGDGTAPAGPSPRPRRAGVRELGGRFGVLAFLALMVVGFSAALPAEFPTAENFRAMIESQAVLLLLAVAATVPLRAGDFDLSISAVLVLAGAMAAKVLEGGGSLAVAALVAVGIGLLAGLVNALLVVKVGIDSFITTLGTLTALTGATYAVTSSNVIFGFDGGVLALARTDILGLASEAWIAWAVVLVTWFVYERTPAGRWLIFVGGGRDVARLAGVPVDRVRMGAFVASGTLAGFAGLVLIGDLGTLDPSTGGGYLLQPFAAAFLGATVIHLGRFNAFGTLVGLYLLTVGITGLQLLGAAPWVSNVFNGTALVLAVTLARVAGGEKAR